MYPTGVAPYAPAAGGGLLAASGDSVTVVTIGFVLIATSVALWGYNRLRRNANQLR